MTTTEKTLLQEFREDLPQWLADWRGDPGWIPLQDDTEDALREMLRCVDVDPGNTDQIFGLIAGVHLLGTSRDDLGFEESILIDGLFQLPEVVEAMADLGVNVVDLPEPTDPEERRRQEAEAFVNRLAAALGGVVIRIPTEEEED